MGNNPREVEDFLADLTVSKIRESANSSYMMIEVSDVEIKDQSKGVSRA